MKRVTTTILLIFALVVLTACGKVVTNVDDPASQHCLDLGGEIEYVDALPKNADEEAGVFGVCHLPGDIDCELWNLFAGSCEEIADRYYCNPDDREFEACLDEQAPVCAYRSTGDLYGEYPNLCEACRDDLVSYVLPGSCLE